MFKKILAGILCCAVAGSMIPASFSASAEETLPKRRLHYAFDGADKNADDITGNNRNGIIYGSVESSSTSVYGQSLFLKGGYIQMPGDVFGDSKNLTISVWTKPMRSTSWSRVWDIGNSTDEYLALMSPSGDGKFACEIKDGPSDSDKARATSSAAFATGAWKHLVVTYSEGGDLTVFENGVQVAKVGIGSLKTADFGNVTRAFIGRSMFSADADYYGYVDDFKVYDGILSAEQITAEYNRGIDSILINASDRLDLAKTNTLNNLTAVQQNLSLPTKASIAASGASIEWRSDNTDIISDSGKLGSKTGKTSLTSTVSLGGFSKSRKFEITVVPASELKADPIEEIITAVGVKPSLPARIKANNATASLTVKWNTPDPTEYAYAGLATATGIAENGEAVSASIITVDSMQNLLIQNGAADPFVTFHDGYYYYVKSEGGISVAKSKRLQDIGTAPRITVYTPPSSGMYSREYWAPEIHFIDGCWYIYVAADDGNNANHRMYCLKSTEPENALAKYEMAGKLAPTAYNESTQKWEVAAEQDKWAIDGTVLQDVDGKNYFVWSGWEGNSDGQQNIYIAEMLNPYTLKGSRVLLSKPEEYWEQKGQTGVLVEEGPQVVKHGSKANILFSCNGSWTDWYSIGSLSVDMSKDLLDPNSWTKSEGPLFTQSLVSTDHSYGTGHACVTTSPDGSEDYLIYHAFHSAGGGWEDRSGRIIKFEWDHDTPLLGAPSPETAQLDRPSGTENAVSAKYEAETAELVNTRIGIEGSRSGGRYALGVGKDSLVTFNAKVPEAGLYQVTLMGGCPSVTSGNCYMDLTVNEKTTVKVRFRINSDSRKTTPACLASSGIREGVYLPLAKGTNKITVTRSADSGGNADLDFLHLLKTGEDDSQKSVESVSISKTSQTITAGDSFSLSASVSPQNAVNTGIVWKSGDERVATVDKNGVVTGVAAGTAEITAYSYNNSEAKAACAVTVEAKPEPKPDPKPSPVPVSSVKLTAKVKTLTVGKTARLTATVLPANASNKAMKFKSSNSKIASVSSSGKITAKAPGRVTITVSASSKTASRTITVLPAKPTKLKITSKKRTLRIKFKKGAGAVYTKIAVYRNGKKHKTKNIKSSSLKLKTSKKGTYKFKALSYKKVSGKTYRSAYATSRSVKVR